MAIIGRPQSRKGQSRWRRIPGQRGLGWRCARRQGKRRLEQWLLIRRPEQRVQFDSGAIWGVIGGGLSPDAVQTVRMTGNGLTGEAVAVHPGVVHVVHTAGDPDRHLQLAGIQVGDRVDGCVREINCRAKGVGRLAGSRARRRQCRTRWTDGPYARRRGPCGWSAGRRWYTRWAGGGLAGRCNGRNDYHPGPNLKSLSIHASGASSVSVVPILFEEDG